LTIRDHFEFGVILTIESKETIEVTESSNKRDPMSLVKGLKWLK